MHRPNELLRAPLDIERPDACGMEGSGHGGARRVVVSGGPWLFGTGRIFGASGLVFGAGGAFVFGSGATFGDVGLLFDSP